MGEKIVVNEERLKIVKSIKNAYDENLFKDGFVDKETGVVKNDLSRKLATYPYIGSMYGVGKRVLIIGFDIGADETPGYIQKLEQRQAIENNNIRDFNPHMGGTYFTVLYFLKDELKLNEYWENFKKSNFLKFNSILRHAESLPEINPLSYIAMTNFFKYVTIGRNARTGGMDRINIDKEREDRLFLKEVEILKPEIIFFQSSGFKNLANILKGPLIEKGIKLMYSYHPSNRRRGKQIPENYIKSFEELK